MWEKRCGSFSFPFLLLTTNPLTASGADCLATEGDEVGFWCGGSSLVRKGLPSTVCNVWSASPSGCGVKEGTPAFELLTPEGESVECCMDVDREARDECGPGCPGPVSPALRLEVDITCRMRERIMRIHCKVIYSCHAVTVRF